MSDSCSINVDMRVRKLPESELLTSGRQVRKVRGEFPQNSADITLADLTTLHLGGSVAKYIETTTEADFIAAIKDADASGMQLLVLGGGSNILALDAPFNGVVVTDTRSEISGGYLGACAGVEVTVSAGASLDALVQEAVKNDWCGLESLSGIPGTVGASCVQNVGAYGSEIAQVFTKCRVWDRKENEIRTLTLDQMEFGYRTSLLKKTLFSYQWGKTPRYVVLDVTFALLDASLSLPIRYKQLADALGVELGQRVNLSQVRKAVIELRQSKGMILSSSDTNTFSAGSFYVNPVVTVEDAENLPFDAPRMPVYDTAKTTSSVNAPLPVVPGVVKTSAAWLISHAGITKGFALPGSRAAVSDYHVLALTNKNGASAKEVYDLAQYIFKEVLEKTGIKLSPEPLLVGLD